MQNTNAKTRTEHEYRNSIRLIWIQTKFSSIWPQNFASIEFKLPAAFTVNGVKISKSRKLKTKWTVNRFLKLGNLSGSNAVLVHTPHEWIRANRKYRRMTTHR